MDKETLYIKRSVYRELFNDACADFSIYKLKHDVDAEFLDIEKKLWEYREKSLRMTCEEIEVFDAFWKQAKVYLAKKIIGIS